MNSKNIKDRINISIAGNPDNTTLEERIYNFVCFIAAAAAFIATCGNFWLKMNPLLTLTTLSAAVAFIILYLLSKLMHKIHTWMILFSSILILSVGWFFNQGSQGPIIFGYFLLSTGFLIICRPEDYLKALLIIYMNLILLYTAEHTWPELVHAYPSDDIRKLDIWISVFSCMMFANLLVIKMKNAFGYERQEAITQTRLKEALKESETKFRAFFNSLNDAVFVHPWQEEGFANFIEVNDSACLRYGYTRDELLKLSPMDITVEEDALKHSQGSVRKKLAEKGSIVFSTIHLTKSKTPFPVEISANFIELKNQKIIIAVVRDVSDRKQAQEDIRRSERRFRDMIKDVSEISIKGYDENGTIIFWNHASEKLYGYSETEALGRKFEDLIVTEDMKDLIKTLHHSWSEHGRKIPSGEMVFIDKHKNEVPVFSSYVMNKTRHGMEIFCIDIDMKPIKQAEEAKKQLQAQLQQAQKMESVGTLAGGIAHDFNNILQAITGYAEMALIDKDMKDEDFFNLNEILKASDRAKHLIKQLLFFSRKAEIQRRPLNINHEINQAKRILEKTIPKMIKIRLNLGSRLWNANVDPVQIEQVILNLGSNSADAMPEGGEILIETANITFNKMHLEHNISLKGGDYVLLKFSDTGIGMSPQTMEKSFEPFFTTKELGKGTGLGLASVYGIVKSHDGYIICESKLNQGTTFSLYFPALKQDFKPVSTPEPDLKQGEETILVVDDEEPVRQLASSILTRFGYKVFQATNGEEALDLLSEHHHHIDLVILDINMPGMGGIGCLKILREKFPATHVVMASGYSEHDHLDCMELGALGYLKKPYRLTDFVNAIREILDQSTNG